MLRLLPFLSLPLSKLAVKATIWFMVYGKNGFNVRDSLPERISKLKTEITKGESVYTPEELKVLDRKLKEENVTMRSLTKPGK